MFLSVFSREIVSTTIEESMMEPSTIASGERRSIPSLTSWYVPPFFSFSSTSLTAEEPISRPTTFLLFEKNTAHPIHLTHFSLAPMWERSTEITTLNVRCQLSRIRCMNRLRAIGHVLGSLPAHVI